MNVQPKPLNEITVRAIGILSKEMGLADTIRFLNQFSTGYGNYTEERRELFGNMSFDEIVAEAKKVQEGTVHFRRDE